MPIIEKDDREEAFLAQLGTNLGTDVLGSENREPSKPGFRLQRSCDLRRHRLESRDRLPARNQPDIWLPELRESPPRPARRDPDLRPRPGSVEVAASRPSGSRSSQKGGDSFSADAIQVEPRAGIAELAIQGLDHDILTPLFRAFDEGRLDQHLVGARLAEALDDGVWNPGVRHDRREVARSRWTRLSENFKVS